MAVFRFLAQAFMEKETKREFAIDSFPIASCEKSRIDRRGKFLGNEYLGYMPSKKRYFCGIRAHMIVNSQGHPIEVLFGPATESDLNVLWKLNLDLPPGSTLYADGAYNCFELEDILLADEQISLLARRRKSMRERLRSPEEEKMISSRRQIVETAFSCITNLLPRCIRAVSETGFILRIFSAILAYSFSFVS